MIQRTITHHSQNYHQSASSNNNNNLQHQPPPIIIKLESDDDDKETVQKVVPTLPTPHLAQSSCLVKTKGKLDYHDDCVCVKCRMIKQFLANLESQPPCTCVECRDGDSSRQNSTSDPKQQLQIHHGDVTDSVNEVARPQTSLKSTSNAQQNFVLAEQPTRINGVFKCRYMNCSKSFTQKSHFNDHEIIHTGKKPFGCSRCMFVANRQSNLASHFRRIHCSEKLYRCAYNNCGYANSVHSTLVRHIRTKHRSVCKRRNWRKVVKKYLEKRFLVPK